MSEREDSDEEHALGLTFYGEEVNTENVNPSLSHPSEESFTPRNEQPCRRSVSHHPFLPLGEAGASSTPHLQLPSRVAALPPAGTATWCPSPSLYSAFHPHIFPDVSGITMRRPDANSYLRNASMVQNSLSLRPGTPSTPFCLATAAEGQKISTRESSELCTAFERTSFNISEPVSQGVCDTGQMEEDPMVLTAAEGNSTECSDHPNNSSTPGNEDNSADAAEDDNDDNEIEEEDDDGDDEGDEDDDVATPVFLRESSPEDAGISKPLTQSTAVAMDLSSMQEDTGDLELFPPEGYAMGIQTDCLRKSEKTKLLGNTQLPCGTSPGSLSSAQFDAGSLNTLGSNLLDLSASAQITSAAVRKAAPSDTGQSIKDDDDLNWGSCKICWCRFWKVVFIPCGHGSCKPCYERLMNMTCPFCRKRIGEIVEVLLAYNFEGGTYSGAST